MSRQIFALVRTLLAICSCVSALRAAEAVEHPFRGITCITRTESEPRNLKLHIVEIDLTARGIGFKLTPPGGSLETVRQTTLEFLQQEHAQVAINGHFFLPFPSTSPDAMVVGFAASRGKVYSAFETPDQSYAIVPNAPAINIDRGNHARIVRRDSRFADGKHVREKVTVWNALAGSAQVITNGVMTIPAYASLQNPTGLLTPGGPRNYSADNSWYDAIQARTAIGLSRNNRILFLLTVDRAGGSLGMKVGEVADLLIRDYGVYNALNLDGGGSATLAMENPVTHIGGIVNVSSDNPSGRSVGSNLAVFAAAAPAPR
jgi:exopolysaccharide biosynthesis protein